MEEEFPRIAAGNYLRRYFCGWPVDHEYGKMANSSFELLSALRQVFEKGRKGADQPQGFQTMLVNTLKCGCSHGMRNELTKRKWLAKEEKKGLSWERTVSFSQKEVSVRMISTPCIEIQTTSENRFDTIPSYVY